MAPGKAVALKERRVKAKSGVYGPFHLAGIIPIASLQTQNWKYPWPEVLAPVGSHNGKGYTAIDKAIVECGWAGCETIWIVANNDMQPILRYYLGSMVCDPYEMEFVRNTASFTDSNGGGDPDDKYSKNIPIYYINLNSISRREIESYGYSILDAARTIEKTFECISEHLRPNKYFVTFPLTINDPFEMKPLRSLLSSDTPVYFSYQGKTVLDGFPAPFTMTPGLAKEARRATWRLNGLKLLAANKKDATEEEIHPLDPGLFPLEKALMHEMPEDSEIRPLEWAFDARDHACYAQFLTDRGLGVNLGTRVLRYMTEVVPMKTGGEIQFKVQREL